jgi:phosphomannomutase
LAPERKLFGTDGVRGPVGELLTPEFALALGRAATDATRAAGARRPQVLLLRDTRDSGPMLEAALAAGVAAAVPVDARVSSETVAVAAALRKESMAFRQEALRL